jgi:hypothetical protein
MGDVLCYKSKGHGFGSRKVIEFLSNLPYPTSRTMALGFVLSPTEMGTRNHPKSKS